MSGVNCTRLMLIAACFDAFNNFKSNLMSLLLCDGILYTFVYFSDQTKRYSDAWFESDSVLQLRMKKKSKKNILVVTSIERLNLVHWIFEYGKNWFCSCCLPIFDLFIEMHDESQQLSVFVAKIFFQKTLKNYEFLFF